jgi:hypothetical protein
MQRARMFVYKDNLKVIIAHRRITGGADKEEAGQAFPTCASNHGSCTCSPPNASITAVGHSLLGGSLVQDIKGSVKLARLGRILLLRDPVHTCVNRRARPHKGRDT